MVAPARSRTPYLRGRDVGSRGALGSRPAWRTSSPHARTAAAPVCVYGCPPTPPPPDAHPHAHAGVVTSTNAEEACKGVDVAVMVGGFPRKAGMERKDVMSKNVSIYAAQV